MSPNIPVEILVVEDNPADARLTQEAFRDAQILNSIHVVRDGEEALRYLRHEGEHAGALRPNFVILDLALPKMSGRQVLLDMKADPSLRSIPVMVLTGAKSDDQISEAYATQASCVIRKPMDVDEYFKAIRSLKEFLFNAVTLPS